MEKRTPSVLVFALLACGGDDPQDASEGTGSSGPASTSSTSMYPVTLTQSTLDTGTGAADTTTSPQVDSSSEGSSGPMPPDVHVVTEPGVELCGSLDPHPPVNYDVYGERYGDVWGFESDGREYAALGNTFGLSIVDVTDDPIVEVGYLPIAGFVPGRAVTGAGDYVYLGGQGPDNSMSYLRVIDVSDPTMPTLVDERTEYTQQIHTIGVFDGTLYLNNGFGTCHFLELGDPELPTEIGQYNGNDCHDVTVFGDRLYVGGGYTSRYDVVDISDLTAPMVLGVTGVEDGIYAHSGALDQTGTYFFGFDEFHIQDMLVYDVSNPAAPSLVTTFSIGPEIPHNGYLRGSYLYVAWYEAGFVLIDVHDPTAPFEALRFPTWPDAPVSEWNGALNLDLGLPSGKVLVTDSRSGLWVLCVETPP